MRTRILQSASLSVKAFFLLLTALCGASCQGGVALSPTLSGGLWNSAFMATISPNAAKYTRFTSRREERQKRNRAAALEQLASSECVPENIVKTARAFKNSVPPENEYGRSSLDFIKGVYEKSCMPLLRPHDGAEYRTALPEGLNPGSIVVLGKGDKRVAALVEKCDAGGTCQLLVRLPDKVHQLKFNALYPNAYRNKGGEVINSLLKLPGSQQIATAGELLLEAHQAYGKNSKLPEETAGGTAGAVAFNDND